MEKVKVIFSGNGLFSSTLIEDGSDFLIRMKIELPDGTTAEIISSPTQANLLILALEI